MPYCVNCGVELTKKEDRCPLCNTIVINPAQCRLSADEKHICMDGKHSPEGEKGPRDGENDFRKGESDLHKCESHLHGGEENSYEDDRRYPEIQQPKKPSPQLKKRLMAEIFTLILIIPFSVTLVINLKINNSITWSFYSMTSIALFWIFVVLPMFISGFNAAKAFTLDAIVIAVYLVSLGLYSGEITWPWYPAAAVVLSWVYLGLPFIFKKYSIVKFIFVDGIATCFFLRFIEWRSNSGPWFYSLALPIVILLMLFVLAVIIPVYHSKLKGLTIAGTSIIAAGFFCVGIDFIIGRYLNNSKITGWSLIVLLACIPLAGVFFLLNRKIELQVLLKKKFHM